MIALLELVSLQRPAGLWALLALPVAWWLARRRDVPIERFTGALALWRNASSDAEAVSARRSTPPGFAWLATALVAAALALAGPMLADAPTAITFVVDRSPSMYLPFDDGRTRLEAALERALALRAELGAREIEWVSPGEPSASSASFPRDWTSAPTTPPPAIDWSRFDRDGVVWITDAEPSASRLRAGIASSGGAAVPGPIGGLGARVRVWDGAQVSEVLAPGVEPALVLAPDVPEPVASIARAWATARGLPVRAPGAGTAAVLEVLATSAAEHDPRAVRAGRDGWEADGSAVAVPGSGEVWLAAGSPEGRIAIVRVERPASAADRAQSPRARPPRVVLGWRELSEPRGDPAAFAVSWAELFDRCAQPPAGTVALAERLDAGPGRTAAPAAARAPGTAPGSARLPHLLTVLGALTAAIAGALWIATRSRGRPRAPLARSGA